MLYEGPRGIALPVNAFDWATAAKASQAACEWIISRREQSTKGFWSLQERRARGYLCEIGFARWRGVSWQHKIGIRHEPDVDGYEVKARAWPSAKVMDNFEGGNYHVPDDCPAQVVVFMSCVEPTLTSRVFFDGWLTKKEILDFPHGGRPGDRPARVVPYAEFHLPGSLPSP